MLVDPADPKKTLRIGARLPNDERTHLVEFFSKIFDVFAWCTTDMPGIDPEIICHRLSIDPSIKSVKQKSRKINAE